MDRELLKGAITGLGFAASASAVVRLLGFSSSSLTLLLYLYVLLGVLPALRQKLMEKIGSADTFLHRLVLVAEEEEMEMKKLVTGEKYRVKGEVEKL